MLGTGNATVTRCYNTCFVLQTERTKLLVDAGGGNGILVQLEKAHIAISDIHNMFVTHAHTDHVFASMPTGKGLSPMRNAIARHWMLAKRLPNLA